MGDFILHLNNYIKKHKATFGDLNIQINEFVDKDLQLNPQQSLNMLRIIQEALSNCVKYAKASEFHIGFLQNNGHLMLRLYDDGDGYKATNRPTSILDGNGLMNMKRRAEELNGALQVSEKGNQGFSIDFEFPLSPNEK